MTYSMNEKKLNERLENYQVCHGFLQKLIQMKTRKIIYLEIIEFQEKKSSKSDSLCWHRKRIHPVLRENVQG